MTLDSTVDRYNEIQRGIPYTNLCIYSSPLVSKVLKLIGGCCGLNEVLTLGPGQDGEYVGIIMEATDGMSKHNLTCGPRSSRQSGANVDHELSYGQ